MKKKLYVILVLIIFVPLITTLFIRLNPTKHDMDSLETYIKIQSEALKIREDFGENSTFAQYYVKKRLLDINDSNDIASSTAENQIIEDKALQFAARNKGIEVSDREVQELMDTVVSTAQEDSNYLEIADLCKRHGISFEDTVYKNEDYYRMNCLRDKLYDDSDNDWERFVDRAVESYKQTQEYDALESFLVESNNIMTKYRNEEISEITTYMIEDIKYFQ